MSDAPDPLPEPSSEALAMGSPAPRRMPWQISMRTLFLLVCAIAVWTSYAINRQQNASLSTKIAAMRPLARELMVQDATKPAVVTMLPLWYDEHKWDFYVPDGQYRICLATRGIDDNGFPSVAAKSRPLPAGRHQLALDQLEEKDHWRVQLRWDEAGELSVEEPKDWYSGSSSSSGGDYSLSTQVAPDEPIVLLRRQFYRPNPKPGTGGFVPNPNGPTEGIMIWIERSGSSPRKP